VDYDPTLPCHSPSGVPDYCAPSSFPGRVAKLFRNLGRTKKGEVAFEDVTLTSGLGALPGPGLGVICADFDGDGWPDIFVANDGAPNRLWINQRDPRGRFREEAVERGVAYNGMGVAEGSMGVALGDVDGSGMFAMFVTHLTHETHTLWKQGPRGQFRDDTIRSGLAASKWRGTGFGTVVAYFDNDGALGVALVTGRVARAAAVTHAALGPHWGWYAERNQVFAGDGKGRFRDISTSNPALCGTPNVARGLAWGDVDGDGAI